MLYNDVDFRNSSDTGEPEATAIQPYLDGEPAGQGVFRRPVENTRSRSDLLRQTLREHLVLRDLQQVLLVGGGTFTFGGAKPTYTGVFTTTADLEVRPFATPGADASPYTVSTKASVLVGSVDIIKFESKYKQWQDPGVDPDIAAEADMISVEIVHTGALSVAVQGAAGQPNNIYVTINYGTTTCQEVIDAVNAHTGANKLVVASLASGTNTNPASKFSTAEWGSDWSVRFLRGGAPGLLHVITAAVFATFFAAHVNNPLRKGDTLAIWYDKLIELSPVAPPPGGRLQSTPENSNYSIPAGSLFNTRREPEKIPNCVPICKCVDDNTIIFVDGSRITRTTAATLWWDSAHLSGGSSSLISVTGWTRLNAAPGAHVPPTTVQQALDNADDLFEAVLNGDQAFIAKVGNRGLTATGDGANEGIKGTGGLTGTGVVGQGGATGGKGVTGTGTANQAGVYGTGGPTAGAGVIGDGAGGGSGGRFTGQGAGEGVYSIGGATGHGIVGTGGGGNTSGVVGQGVGSGKGVDGTGGATAGAIGVKGTGGSTNGVGVEGRGIGSGVGVNAVGGATGEGINGTGGGSGKTGVVGTGGSGDAYGIVGNGVGNKAGVYGTGGATGNGVTGQGGTTSGIGVSGTGGPNSAGVYGAGTGSGHGVDALGGSSGSAYGVYAMPRANTAAIYGDGEAYNAHGVIGEGGEGGGYGVYAKKGDSWALYADNDSKINGQLEVNDANNGSWLHVINRNIWGDTGRLTWTGSLANGSWFMLTDTDWQTGWDLGAGGHIVIGQPGLYFPVAGYYRIDGRFFVPAGGTPPYPVYLDYLYGATSGVNTIQRYHRRTKSISTETDFQDSFVYYCAAGSHFTLQLYQLSTASLTCTTEITCTRVLAP